MVHPSNNNGYPEFEEHKTPAGLKTSYPPQKETMTMAKRSKIGHLAMRTMFVFAKRFIAGETVEEAIPAVERLKKEGFNTTLDILGESVTRPQEARDVTNDYCKVLDILKEKDLDVNMSLKLTQLGLDIGEQFCFDNVAKILVEAGKLDAFIRVDMEGSDCTTRTLNMVRRWHEIYPCCGTVLQAMLKRSQDDLDDLLSRGISIRLCKGAYKEPADIAFADKRDVDNNYIAMAEKMLRSGIYHGIATHDEKIIDHLKKFASEIGLGKDGFEFQMLLGIRPNLQQQLIKEGYRLRLYVPYGDAWLPYTIRRMRERKENFWFVLKNIVRR